MSEATLGAGGVKSSIKDMLRYLEANLGCLQTTVNESLVFAHQSTQEIAYPFVTGLGWDKIIKESDNTQLIWHNGGTTGTVAFIGFVNELDMGVVLFFNTEINDRTGNKTTVELEKGAKVIEAMKRF